MSARPNIVVYFDPRPSLGDDFLTHDGAAELARRIEAYWKGLVRCRVEEVSASMSKAYGRRVYCVRSDMVNGSPR